MVIYDNPCDEIIDYLFIGNANAVKNTNNQKFTMIVNCTRNSDISFPSYCKKDHCIRFPIDDNPDQQERFLELLRETNVLEKIHYNIMMQEPVLVHCFAGMQRSCAVVACYLIKYYDMTPYEAVTYIQSKRHVAFFGNVNFSNAIRMFYKNHKNQNQNQNQN